MLKVVVVRQDQQVFKEPKVLKDHKVLKEHPLEPKVT